MNMKLNQDEHIILQSLDPERGTAEARATDGAKRLFEFNLITRRSSGELTLTKSGQRALFQQDCLCALAAMNRGEPMALSSGVQRWLVASGFIDEDAVAVTPRGTLWLKSFDADPPAPIDLRTAEGFALRRAANAKTDQG